MIQLPKLNNVNIKSKKYTYAFGGINKQEDFSVGELEQSENISFDSFPAISSGREKTEPAMMNFDSAYTYIDAGGALVAYKYNSDTKELTLFYLPEKKDAVLTGETVIADAEEKERYAARLGKYVVVFPDKLYLDLEDTDSGFKTMEKYVEIADRHEETLWLYSGKIVCEEKEDYRLIKNNFAAGDVITLNGVWYVGNDRGGTFKDKKLIIRELDDDNYTVYFDPNSLGVNLSHEDLGDITIKLEVPSLTKLAVFSGRVWGFDADGKIYASKYNNPLNFEYFDLSSADSYTLETDTVGEFTAIYAMADHIAFFKEDKIHRITGTKPSNFRHSVIYTDGVKAEADKTLAQKNEILYYVGVDGVYIYNGGLSQKISSELGDIEYKSGAAVFYNDTYYISIVNEENTCLFGYDTKKGMWLMDGPIEFKNAFKFLGESLYINSENEIKKIGDNKDLTRDLSVTLREIQEENSEQKGWGRLYICARLNKGDNLKIEVSYGYAFETVGIFTDYRKTVFEIRLKPNRGDKVHIRLTASPNVVITKIMREHHVHGSVF